MGTAGYVTPHVARSADYDSLLVLFTTGAVMAFGLALEPRTATEVAVRPCWIMCFAGMTILALFTKDIAACLMLPGLVVYAALRRSLVAMVLSPVVWACALLVLVVTATFLVLRESAAPGYVQALLTNDVTGRFAGALDGHPGPWWQYLNDLVKVWPLGFSRPFHWMDPGGSAFPWSWLFPLSALSAITSKTPAARRAALLALCAVASLLFFISSSQTKLAWYNAPVYPFLAVLTGLGAKRVWDIALQSQVPLVGRLLPVFSIAGVCACVGLVSYNNALGNRYIEADPQRMTEFFVRDLLRSNPSLSPVRILHDDHGPILSSHGVSESYRAPEEFYAITLRLPGSDISVVDKDYVPRAGEVLVWCDKSIGREILMRGALIKHAGVCTALRLT
jgi:hypothetical protein